jgi:RNA polymerase sigma factor (sigma-70 family)
MSGLKHSGHGSHAFAHRRRGTTLALGASPSRHDGAREARRVLHAVPDVVDDPHRPDDELIARAAGGDTDAYAALVRRYQELAVRTAFLVTGHAEDAQDAAQEAFTKAYYGLGRFEPDRPFRPWLLRIVVNEARNRRKATRRRAELTLRAFDHQHLDSGEPGPEAALLANERRTALLDALAMLREQDRLAIAYRYFFDLSEAELAEALGVARGTVKSRLSRALSRLRDALAKQRRGEARRQESSDD